MTRYWLKDFGGARHVRKVVSLSGLIKGSPFQADAVRNGQCPPPGLELLVPPELAKNPSDACLEMSSEGDEVRRLNTPSEALPGIRYYNITTTLEYDASPYRINLMDGPGDYYNIVTQDLCPNDPVVHLTMTMTPSVQSLVASALKGGSARNEMHDPRFSAGGAVPEGRPAARERPQGHLIRWPGRWARRK